MRICQFEMLSQKKLKQKKCGTFMRAARLEDETNRGSAYSGCLITWASVSKEVCVAILYFKVMIVKN